MADNEIQKLQQEIENLRAELRKKERQLHDLRFKSSQIKQNSYSILSTLEVSKYSRQMLVPQIGISGQKLLKESKVLIVGIGGLGCPAALYLAAAGVGEITLVDNDVVDLTNLHRQILHSELDLGTSKVQSAFETLKSINNDVQVIPLCIHADSTSLFNLVQENKYTIVIDGTDNVATRYLLNDVCVMTGIPLISGSALQLEGQLTVYNYNNGPCYRCLFPKPPPPNTVTSCGDGGVLGVVPGVVGILEALEAIKIITAMPGVLSGRLLLFDGSETTFRNVKLRNRKADCEVCGIEPSIKAPIDYEQFCGAKAHDKVENISILKPDETISITEFSKVIENDPILIDVRPFKEFEICSLPNSLNIPYDDVQTQRGMETLNRKLIERSSTGCPNVYVICRRGNDSQRAISLFKKEFATMQLKFINIKGGLHAYSREIDSSFPIY